MAKYAPARDDGLVPYVLTLDDGTTETVWAETKADAPDAVLNPQRVVKVRRALTGETP